MAASVFWALAFNGALFSAVTNGRQTVDAWAWGLAFALAGGLVALKVFLGGMLAHVSGHGESLGERGLFLHGLPYALAPDVQKRVPMVWWNSAGFERASGLDGGCLMASMASMATQARKPVAHDHLFHTLLGALDVWTARHEPSLDLTQPRRAARAL